MTIAAQRIYRPADAKAQRDIEAAARELSQEAVIDFADRVLHRLEKAPRYQSLGRNKYVYVGDVKQAIDEELHLDRGAE